MYSNSLAITKITHNEQTVNQKTHRGLVSGQAAGIQRVDTLNHRRFRQNTTIVGRHHLNAAEDSSSPNQVNMNSNPVCNRSSGYICL